MEPSEARSLVASALESGEYKQCTRTLERLGPDDTVVGNCCLGVACRVFMKLYPNLLKTGIEKEVTSFSWDFGCFKTRSLPPIVQQWLGFRTDLGHYGSGLNSLAIMNDDGMPFSVIAQLLRKDEIW